MPIGINGQYIFSFTVGNKKDFIKKEDFGEVTIIEEVGNVLPTFTMSFASTDEDILRQLNEGNVLLLQIGKDSNNLKDIKLSTSRLRTSKEGSDKRLYNISGFASEINYVTDHSLKITSSKSAIEATIETAKKSFKVKSNITRSYDKQKWIQYNITDKRFISECFMHCDLKSSFPAVAITADGTFILKDILKDINRSFSSPYDWRFTKEIKDSRKDIIYDSDYMIDSNSGFINNWVGYGRETIVNNLDTGFTKKVLEQPEPILSMSKAVDKSTTVDKRYNGPALLSENVHALYHDSYNHNLMALSNLSKIDNVFSFSNLFYDVKPLDLAMFSDKAITSVNQSSEYVSGLYIISKVARTIQKERLVTTCVLNREAFNRVKNA